jgi:hypothetical protein
MISQLSANVEKLDKEVAGLGSSFQQIRLRKQVSGPNQDELTMKTSLQIDLKHIEQLNLFSLH